jgi:tripartite-type tricarboxylate transporter receptor subunit TctC
MPRGARAQEAAYPSRPITMVVPLAPGGAGDILARPLAQFMGAELGQPVVIDNRPGAGGTVAHAFVARARPDGYTLLMSTNSTYAIAPHLYPVTYDYGTAFAPITRFVTTPQVLCLHRSVPAGNLAEFIAWLKRNPGKIAFGSAGIGFTSHLAAELFMAMAGVSMLHVPYRGGGPAGQALMSGEIQLNFADTATALAVTEHGAARALAVTTPQRSPLFPDLPTMHEAGLTGYQSATDYAFVAPAGTPEPILSRVLATMLKFLATPEERDRLLARGYVPVGSSPAEFTTSRVEETEKWGNIIRTRGIRMP